MSRCIGITVGDVTGIGPEVVLKALAEPGSGDDFEHVIIGPEELIQRLNQRLDLNLPLESSGLSSKHGRIGIWDPGPHGWSSDLGPGSEAAARAALSYLEEGARRCLRGELDALVTGPVSKQAIIRSGTPFIGQTEFLSELAGVRRTAMMLLGEDGNARWLRVALVTTHLALRDVPGAIRAEKIEEVIELAANACQQLRLGRARIGVCGLNPHAGEGGEFGTEEQTLIAPAVQAAREKGLDVSGPLPADSLFYSAYHGRYDAVVAMYHDQGLVPLKMIGFDRGVNWTLGLPFVRTSPDHGTAYDIAGQNRANSSSMKAALELAKNLARRRC